MPITFWAKRFDRVLTDMFFLEPYFESGGGLGVGCWAGWGWAGLAGRAGLGLGCLGLCWLGCAGAGWAGLG